jgi:hypothetical protein
MRVARVTSPRSALSRRHAPLRSQRGTLR